MKPNSGPNFIPRVKIHPTSVRLIKDGHPWITRDSFTNAFPKKHDFLIGVDASHKEVALFIHDPSHNTVKGRVWRTSPPFNTFSFTRELVARLSEALNKRKNSLWIEERENIYLVFGEADALPGLFVQKISKTILIQTFSSFWTKQREILIKSLIPQIKSSFPQIESLYWQDRHSPGNSPIQGPWPFEKKAASEKQFTCEEFGIKYLVKMDAGHDVGLYTDMSSVRKKITPLLKESQKVLNLFSYTGAFTLLAQKHGAHVTSVDLSVKANAWLEENLRLNPSIEPLHGRILTQNALSALKNLDSKREKFNFIICDPPSVSSDKLHRSSALSQYEKLLPLMTQIVSNNGYLLLFLNTHTASLGKFKDKIKTVLSGLKGIHTTLEQTFGLDEDCPTLSSFPEGNYLKGLLFRLTR